MKLIEEVMLLRVVKRGLAMLHQPYSLLALHGLVSQLKFYRPQHVKQEVDRKLSVSV